MKNKSLKRRSEEENRESVKKVKRADQVEQTEKNTEMEEGELSNDSSVPSETEDDGLTSGKSFDYEAADYTIFKKAQQKAQGKKQQIKERFKGKVCD